MKKQLFIQIKIIAFMFLATLGLLNYQPVRALSQPIFTVSTPLELINAIGPDRTLQLKTGVFELPSRKINFSNKYVLQQKVNDGYQIVIRNVKNLTISGLGEKPVKILAKPRYAYIFAFSNSNRITMNNIEAGHTPGESGCITGVFSFEKCGNIEIHNSILFGCGSEGINLKEVDGFQFKNSFIQQCTFGIMTIESSRNCVFENATFRQNQGWYLINLDHSANISFSKCQINDNKAEGSDYSSIFDVSDSENISVNDCTVQNNMAEWFIFKSSGLQVKNTPLDDNTFKRGNSYQEENPYSEFYDNINTIFALQLQENLLGEPGNPNPKKEYQKMITALEKMQKNDDNDEVEFLLAEYYALGNKLNYAQTWNKAEQCYQKSISLNPDFVQAHIALADLYFERCIAENTELSGNDLVFVYTLKKQQADLMPEVLKEYLTAVKLSDKNVAPQVFYRIFAVYCFQGEFDKAIQFAKMLVALFPEERSYQDCLKFAQNLLTKKTIPEKINITLK